MKRATRVVLGLFALGGSFLVSGCLKSTEPFTSSIHLAGTWNYTGVQTSPVPETLSGTLTISLESGVSFHGRLDLVAVNSQSGQQRVLAGLVSGAQRGNNLIDFDGELEGSLRRHVGEMVADTVTGAWVASAPDGSATASGSFRIERQSK